MVQTRAGKRKGDEYIDSNATANGGSNSSSSNYHGDGNETSHDANDDSINGGSEGENETDYDTNYDYDNDSNNDTAIVVRRSYAMTTTARGDMPYSWDALKENFHSLAVSLQWQAHGGEQEEEYEDEETKDEALTKHQPIWKRKDPIALQLQEYKTTTAKEFGAIQQEFASVSSSLNKKLTDMIESALLARQKRQERLHAMQLESTSLRAEREALLQDSEEKDDEIQKLQDQLASIEKVTQEDEDEIDRIRWSRTRRIVPEMKQRISLYSCSTGIKFDFEENACDNGSENNEGILKIKPPSVVSGEMNVPSLEKVQKFRIERRPSVSDFELANRLWGIMEGNELHNDGNER